jgi:polysaccharide export outer membrane protein
MNWKYGMNAGLWIGLLVSGAGTLAAQAVTTAAMRNGAEVHAPNLTALRPGDMLRLRIWKEPDFSGDFLIDETGQAVLPRLGRTQVSGMPTDQLKCRLENQFREFLVNPTIEITPLRQISILGAVRNPGVFRIEPSVTLGDAPSLAGGITDQSRRNTIELRRGGELRTIDLLRNPEMATMPLNSGDQLHVPQVSWLRQNATWFVSTVVGVLGTAAFLIAR